MHIHPVNAVGFFVHALEGIFIEDVQLRGPGSGGGQLAGRPRGRERSPERPGGSAPGGEQEEGSQEERAKGGASHGRAT